MTDNELKRIFSSHIDDWCRDQEGEKTFEDYVLSAMREAVQKGSIGFAAFLRENYKGIPNSDKWESINSPDTNLYTEEQLYQKHKKENE